MDGWMDCTCRQIELCRIYSQVQVQSFHTTYPVVVKVPFYELATSQATGQHDKMSEDVLKPKCSFNSTVRINAQHCSELTEMFEMNFSLCNWDVGAQYWTKMLELKEIHILHIIMHFVTDLLQFSHSCSAS